MADCDGPFAQTHQNTLYAVSDVVLQQEAHILLFTLTFCRDSEHDHPNVSVTHCFLLGLTLVVQETGTKPMSHTGLPFLLCQKKCTIVVRTLQLQSLVILNVTHKRPKGQNCRGSESSCFRRLYGSHHPDYYE